MFLYVSLATIIKAEDESLALKKCFREKSVVYFQNITCSFYKYEKIMFSVTIRVTKIF